MSTAAWIFGVIAYIVTAVACFRWWVRYAVREWPSFDIDTSDVLAFVLFALLWPITWTYEWAFYDHKHKPRNYTRLERWAGANRSQNQRERRVSWRI